MEQTLPIYTQPRDSFSSQSTDSSSEYSYDLTKIERPKLERSSNHHYIMTNFEITNELIKMNNKIDKLLSLLTEKNK